MGVLDLKRFQIFQKVENKDQFTAPLIGGQFFLTDLAQVAEAHAQHFCCVQQWASNVRIKKIKKLTEDKFQCIAEFLHSKKSAVSQKIIPDKLAFSFKFKRFTSPAGCDVLEEPKPRKCWELESTVPSLNVM